jgi:predicted chitinase/lysozyme family protein
MSRAIDIVRKVAPRARESYSLAFEQGDALLKAHDITTPPRLAHFLAQVLHETDGLTIQWESGNYSAPRLFEIFGVGHHSAAVTQAEASQLCSQPMPKREELIFERVYGLGNPKKAKELGNVNPGDGYRYRGGGILQTTGRGEYRRWGEKCQVEFEGHPELIVSAEHALKPALLEWSAGNLNAAADRDDIVAITRKINGGLNGLESRREWLAKVRPLIKSVELAEGLVAPGPTPDLPHLPSPPSAPGPAQPVGASDLAGRVIAAMERKGYSVDRGPGELNIAYVEGMNADGTPNPNEANKWNDLRMVIRFDDGAPKIVGLWAATTEPGRYYTDHPLSPLGAARIAFGQYKAWQVGMHHPNKPSGHEALIQTGGEVTVCRDLNRDGKRDGDKRETGEFGINQHWGYDLAEVDNASAGCLVGQSKDGHRAFMAVVKSDSRYQAGHDHVFATAVLPAAEVLAEGKPSVGPPADQKEDDLPLAPSDVSDDVRRLQKLLGFPEEEQDGIFGAITEEAVERFQRRHSLPVTGEVDGKTRDALEREAAGGPEISLPGAKPVEPGAKPVEPVVKPVEPSVKPVVRPVEPSVEPVGPSITPVEPRENVFIPNFGLGVGAMNPLLLVAARVLPDIIKTIAGDKLGTVAGAVTQAVTDITQTRNPEEATKKLNADPAAVAALQLKLAEIAAAQEEKRQQAQLAQLKEQNEAQLTLLKQQNETQLAQLKEQNEQEIKRREAQLAELRADMEDTKDARSSFAALALANNPMAWGAPVVSFIVTLGFFGILVLLMTGYNPPDNSQVQQIVNITVGALAAAFATVVSFWLGSSQGSRAKDVATLQMQADQASQTTAALDNQAKQAEALRNTVQAHAKQAEVLQSTIQTAMAARPAADSKPSNFRRSVDIVLAQQGGFLDDPKNPDAAAQFGIALGVLKDWRQKPNLTADDLRKLERDEACEIYRTRYWNVLRCDDLPTGVDLVVFDFGVDAGTARSAKMLQQVVGAAPDGSIGDATVAATKAMRATDVVKDMSNRRSDYYRDPANAPSSVRDGTNRTNAVEKAALEMISAIS